MFIKIQNLGQEIRETFSLKSQKIGEKSKTW